MTDHQPVGQRSGNGASVILSWSRALLVEEIINISLHGACSSEVGGGTSFRNRGDRRAVIASRSRVMETVVIEVLVS
jgi:hypothetical protein